MNRLENADTYGDKYGIGAIEVGVTKMDKHDKQQAKLLEADERKQELHHYDGRGGLACVVYLLKAYVGSDSAEWEYEFNECDNPYHQYDDGSYEFPQIAFGFYSRGESPQAQAHGKRHTDRTGERYVIMETYITL